MPSLEYSGLHGIGPLRAIITGTTSCPRYSDGSTRTNAVGPKGSTFFICRNNCCRAKSLSLRWSSHRDQPSASILRGSRDDALTDERAHVLPVGEAFRTAEVGLEGARYITTNYGICGVSKYRSLPVEMEFSWAKAVSTRYRDTEQNVSELLTRRACSTSSIISHPRHDFEQVFVRLTRPTFHPSQTPPPCDFVE